MERTIADGYRATNDKGILIRNIYYMLTYAFRELKRNNYDEIAGEDFDEIHNLFAEILYRGVSYQLKKGLHREYVLVQDSLQTVRGKINMAETIRNRMRMNRSNDCEYDELSVNNVFNQILKTTLCTLLKCEEVQSVKRANLKRLLPFFGDVDVIDVHTIRWNTLCFGRNNATYQMLIYICYFLLNGMLLSTESGKYKMCAFSDEHMCRLYEKFILEYYRKHHPELHPHDAQIPWNIEVEESSTHILPILQTDIMLENVRGHTLIIDAKYYGRTWQEHYDKKTVHSHNLYQILAYVTNKDRSHKGNVDGMLLYAKTQESVVPDGKMKCIDGNIIYFKTLDLNQKFENIKVQLEKIVGNKLQNG